MNVITLMGRLTAAPELKTTQNGIEYCNFTVAINRPKNKDGTQVADFLPCTAWRQTAAFISNYFHKGDMIAVNGELQTRKYQDNSGQNRTAYDIIVNRAYFTGGKNQSVTGDTQQTAPHNPYANGVPQFEPVEIDENLPF